MKFIRPVSQGPGSGNGSRNDETMWVISPATGLVTLFWVSSSLPTLLAVCATRCSPAGKGTFLRTLTPPTYVHLEHPPTIPRQRVTVYVRQWRKSVSQSGGGHQGEARRAELRVEASRPVGPRGGGVLGKGDMPPPHQLGIMGERCKLPQWGPGRSPGDLAIFVDSGTQEVILVDSMIQNQR